MEETDGVGEMVFFLMTSRDVQNSTAFETMSFFAEANEKVEFWKVLFVS